MTPTEQRLKEIREREAKATPGEWVAGTANYNRHSRWKVTVTAGSKGAICNCYVDRPSWANHEPIPKVRSVEADFIAHARQDIPFLLSQLELARRVVEAGRELVELMDAVRDGEYKPDSFTNQTMTEALHAYDGADQQKEGK